MCDNNPLNDYKEWIDEATSKSELKDTLYDIRNDALDEDTDDDNEEEGGRQYTLRR